MIIDVTNEFENIHPEGKIIKISGRDDIKPYLNIIWSILEESYKSQGGFKSYSNPKSLRRGYKFVYLYFYKDILAACAIYRGNIEGNKRVGIGAYKHIPGAKSAAHSFIKHDIKNYKLHYWSEVSGPIETLCKKYNAYPIPNDFTPYILNLNNNDIKLLDDGVHYERIISDSDDPDIKMIFGFKNDEIYNLIMDKMKDLYEKFRNRVNSINEDYWNIDHIPMQIRKLLWLYESFYQLYFEQGYAEISEPLYNLLKKVIFKLNQVPRKYTNHINNIDDLLNYFSILKLNKF